MAHNYVYLVHRKDFIDDNLPIYKLGRSSREYLERFRDYPKGSQLVVQMLCSNSVECEKELLKIFGRKYNLTYQVGREYFSGDACEMVKDIFNLVTVKYNAYLKRNIPDEQVESEMNEISKSKLYQKSLSVEKQEGTVSEQEIIHNKNRCTAIVTKIPSFSKEAEIIKDVRFLSDPEVTFTKLALRAGTAISVMELLGEVKKCLIFALHVRFDDSGWYGYYSDGIRKVSVKDMNMLIYRINDKKLVKLGNLVQENMSLGFIKIDLVEALKEYNEMVELNREIRRRHMKEKYNPESVAYFLDEFPIFDYDINLPVTHIFMNFEFETGDDEYYTICTELITVYWSWLEHNRKIINESDAEWHIKIHKDVPNSLEEFGKSIPAWTETGDAKIYKKRHETGKWRIYRKQ